MTPLDYFNAGEKHLKFCLDWKIRASSDEYKTNDWDLLEIFYLSGYAVECFTLFIIYRVGPWDPIGESAQWGKSNKVKRRALQQDIKENFDPVFTHFTGFDFYRHSKNPEAIRIYNRLLVEIDENHSRKTDKSLNLYRDPVIDSYIWSKTDGSIPTNFCSDSSLKKCLRDDHIDYRDLLAKRGFVQGHGFQDAIKNVINNNIKNLEGLDTIDFFNSYKKHKLLLKWKPELRYYSSVSAWERDNDCSMELNKSNLFKLIDLIYTFYQNIEYLKKP